MWQDREEYICQTVILQYYVSFPFIAYQADFLFKKAAESILNR